MVLKRLRRVAFVGWDVAEASLGRVARRRRLDNQRVQRILPAQNLFELGENILCQHLMALFTVMAITTMEYQIWEVFPPIENVYRRVEY